MSTEVESFGYDNTLSPYCHVVECLSVDRVVDGYDGSRRTLWRDLYTARTKMLYLERSLYSTNEILRNSLVPSSHGWCLSTAECHCTKEYLFWSHCSIQSWLVLVVNGTDIVHWQLGFVKERWLCYVRFVNMCEPLHIFAISEDLGKNSCWTRTAAKITMKIFYEARHSGFLCPPFQDWSME